MTPVEFHKFLLESVSTFFKKCPICGNRYKDTLDNMILCKECDREDKIKKILNDKSNF
jgi:hypothetical protein